MAKALNVSLAVTADTSQAKAQLQGLQSTLASLSNSSTNLHLGLDTSTLTKAIGDVDKLQAHLKNATNINTGTLNFSKLNNSIKASGSSLQDYGNSLLRLGPQGQQAFNQLTQAIAKSEIPMSRMKGLLGEFGTVISNTIRWQAASSAIHGMMGAVQGAFTYAQDLNRSLTNIQIVTQASDEHMAKFAESANKAAKSLSTTTTQYTNASLIYYQQGLNDKQVAERAEITLKLANVSGQSAEKVSDQMTAIWNNFAKGGENLEYYADVITALGAATASSSEEIATGLEKFASIADTVGLSYNNASAALATITATTRQSADTVGTGLRTLFSRLQSLSLGDTLEDGVNLTKYTKALQTVGVQALDASGQLRSMDDIIFDLGNKWDDLTKAQQTALAQTVGGVRQYTTLIALMDNFDFYKDNLKIAQNSEETVAAQAEIYAKSWEASQKRVRAAAEDIYSDLINDNFFIDLNNSLAGFLDILDQIIDGMGGLKTLIPMIGAALTSAFSAQATQGLVNLSNNIKMFMPGAAKRDAVERNEFLENAAVLQTGFMGKNLSQSQQIQLNFAKKDIDFQQKYVQNAQYMNDIERMIAQGAMDKYSNLRNAYAQNEQKIFESRYKQSDARSNMVGINGSALSRYSQQNRLNTEERNQYNTALQAARLRSGTVQGEKPKYFQDNNSGVGLWFHSDGSFSKAIYDNLFNKSGDLNTLTSSINDTQNELNILKQLGETGFQGRAKAIKDLRALGGNKEGILSIQNKLIDKGILDIDNKTINQEALGQEIQHITEEQDQMVSDFAAKWGKSKESVMKYKDAIIETNGDLKKQEELKQQITQQEELTEEATKKNQQIQNAEKIVKYAQAMQSAVATGQSFAAVTENIATNLENGGSIFDNFGQTLSGVTSGVMSFAMTAAAIPGPWGIALAAVSAFMGVISQIPWVQDTLHNLFTSDDQLAVEKWEKATDSINTSLEEATEKAADFLNATGTHNQLLEEINKCTQGTNEFKQAILEANNYARQMMQDFDLSLDDFERDPVTGVLTPKIDENNKTRYENKQIALEAQQNNLELISMYTQYEVETAKLRAAANQFGKKAPVGARYSTGLAADISGNDLIQEYLDNRADSETFDEYLSKNFGLGHIAYKQMNKNIQQLGYKSIEDYIGAVEDYGVNGATSIQFNGVVQDLFKNIATQAVFGNNANIDYATFLSSYLANQNNAAELIENYTLDDYLIDIFDNADQEDAQKINDFKNRYSDFLDGIEDPSDWLTNTEAVMDFLRTFADMNESTLQQLADEGTLAKSASAFISIQKGLQLFETNYDKLINDPLLEKVTEETPNKTQREQQIDRAKIAAEIERYKNSIDPLTEEQELILVAYKNWMNQFDEAKNLAAERAMNLFANDDKYKDNNGEQVELKNELLELIQNSSLSDTELAEVLNLGSQMKSVLGQAFNADQFKGLFDNTDLINLYKSIDWSSQLTAFFDIAAIKNRIGDIGTELSAEINSLYETLLDDEHLSGKKGILEELYNTAEFQDSLESLQKTFKKTGKLSAKDIMEAADSCEILNDYLEYGDQSASALAAAIELMGIGGASSIDQISEAFLAAMGAAGAFEDQLQDVFKFIDEFSPDRSIQDIADFFSETSDDMFTELGNGNYGGERLYQEAAAIWGDTYAAHLKNFFIEQQTEALNEDLGPEVLQEAYKEQFDAFDNVMQTVAKEGNMRAYWDFLLEGGGDQILGQQIDGEYGYSNVIGENNERLKISEGLREHAGITNIGKNGDIEVDLQGRTTEMFTQNVADALGISYDEAAIKVQEMSGKSAALTHDLKRNDAAAGLLELGRGHEEAVDMGNEFEITSKSIEKGFNELSWAEQTAFLQKYGDVLSEVDSEMGTHLVQLNEQRQAERDAVATLRASGATREDMNQSIADTVAAYEDLIVTTEANGKSYTDFGQTMSNLTSAGYTQQEVLQAVADGAIDLGNASYIVEDAFGNKIPVALQQTEDNLIDIEAAMSDAERKIHDSNIAHDAQIQAQAFVEAFTGINIEDKDIGINVNDDGSANNVQELINGITGKDIDITINPIDNVSSAIDTIINSYNGRSIILNINENGGSSATGGYVSFGSFASGTEPVKSNRLRPGISLTGEEGAEIVWNKNKGYSYIVGEKHPEFVTLYPGDRVFNAKETAEILGSSAIGGKVYESNADASYGLGVGPKSSSSNATAANAKKSNYEPERYHLITRQLKDLQREYDRLSKVKDNAYGTNKLEAIQAEVDATNDLIEGQKALIREAEDYVKIDAERLKGMLAAGEFQIDENGNLKNFEELQEKYRRAAEEDKDEHAQDVWKALQQYEETLDKLQEANVEMQDLLYQEMELRLEKITTKAELKIDFDEREIKLLDHYIKRIDDNIYHTAEVLALTEQKLGNIASKITTTKEAIDGIFAELSDSQGNRITKKDGSNYTLEDWLALSNEERDLLNINDNFGKQLEEYMDNLLDYIEELEEFKTKGVEEFADAFSELNDNVRSSIDLFDHYNSLLSSLKNITDLQGVKLSAEMRAAMKEIDAAMFGNTQNNIDAERENYRRLNASVAELRQKVAETTDETLKKQWEEQLKTAEDELRTSEGNLLSLWETGLRQAKDMFESALDEAATNYESTIAGMYVTTDELQKAWDQQKKNDEFYVKDYEKYYQISKLQRSITKDLDAAARSGNKQNQGLKKLFDDLNAARENGVELSAYDLDIFAKRYEYEKALMELEDARNNKSEVRLQRDANGNWGYVYTSAADDDDLIAKQQAVDDKFYELQKATQERVASLSDDMMSEITGVGRRLQELRSSGASQETIDAYLEQERKYLENYRKGLAQALADAGMTEEEAKLRYGEEGFDILDQFSETLLSAITGGNETLDDFFARVGAAMEGTNDEMAQAAGTYNDNMKAINDWFNESGEDLATVIKGFTSVISEESDGNLIGSKEQIQNAKDTFDEILKVATNFEQKFLEIYQPIINANEQLVADLLKALHALNAEEYKGPGRSSNPDTRISDLIQMDTGGYTSSWGSSGRLAMLHEKELVLNKDDTANFLNATQILRTIDLQTKAFSNGFGSMIIPWISDMAQQTLDQNVHIEASFPNVTDHNEIELAFDNLVNKASQYANRKNMSSMTFQDMYTSKF